MRISDWSSDVCSSDLRLEVGGIVRRHPARGFERRHFQPGGDLVFGLEPAQQYVELELPDHADHPIGADLGIEDLRHAFLGHVVERLRSEWRSGGKECVCTGRYRWSLSP